MVHMSGESPAAIDRAAANVTGALAVAVADRLYADSRAAALVTLLERGALSIEWLRRIVGLSHSAAVHLVDRLVGEDLVRRRAGPDRRSVSIALTPRGRRTASRLRSGREASLVNLLAPLDAQERRILLALADKLLGGMVSGR